MPVFIPVPNTALVEMLYTSAGHTIENTFHVAKGSPFSGADLITLANVFDDWDGNVAYADRWQAVRGSATILFLVDTKALDTSSSPTYGKAIANRAGGRTGTQMPPNVSFALSLRTGLAGRSQRGRIYAPGLSSGDINVPPSQNQIVAASATALVASLTKLKTLLTTAGFTLVVTSFRTGGAYRAVGQNTPVTSILYTTLKLATMRRRVS